MWELDCEESWATKNWCFWTVVLKKTFESPLDSKELQPVYPKGNQSWIFIWRTDAEAETPILWPPDAKNWLIGEDLDAGKDLRQEEKGTTEDEMVGWHHRLDGPEFEQALGVGDGQGSMVCMGVAKSRTRLSDWTELKTPLWPHRIGGAASSIECLVALPNTPPTPVFENISVFRRWASSPVLSGTKAPAALFW